MGEEYGKRDFSHTHTEPPDSGGGKVAKPPDGPRSVCAGWVRRPPSGDLRPPRPRAQGALHRLPGFARIRCHQTWGQRASRTPIV